MGIYNKQQSTQVELLLLVVVVGCRYLLLNGKVIGRWRTVSKTRWKVMMDKFKIEDYYSNIRKISDGRYDIPSQHHI